MKKFRKIYLFFLCLVFSLSACLYAFGESIVIYGDSQRNPEIQRKLVQTIISFKPEIVFRVGDIVDNGNDPELWKVFSDIHGPLLNTAEYFPALGNHEYDSPLYFEQFPLLHGRRWYSVDRAGIHFVVLDTNSRIDAGSEQYRWLNSDLSAADKAKFIIVIFHHPLFDVGQLHMSDERNIKPVIMPVFEKYAVSAVFSGHSHNYQRFEYNGIFFIVTGGGGSNLYRQTRDDPHLRKFSLTYHFCLLTPEGDFLNIKVIDIDANIIDEFKIPAKVESHAVN